MKTLALLISLTVGVVALEGCHWNHHNHSSNFTRSTSR
jgi:hypothetical protein